MSHPKHASGGPARARVLFLAGTGRSGSTVVSNLLGSVPGAVSVGELRYLWERGIGESALCGCGQAFPACPFWADVMDRAYPDGSPNLAQIRSVERELLRLRALPRLLREHGEPRALGPGARWYADELARVYAAVSDATSGAVVVDSSKLVSYGYLLAHVDGIDVSVLHLVRDPRGVAHSWSRTRVRGDRGRGHDRMGQESPARSSVLWDVWNGTAERLWGGDPARYVRVRYEDVVADPGRALEPVLQMMGLHRASIPAGPDGSAELSVSHTVAGNPGRMTSGPTRLTADTEWRSAMPTPDRLLVTAATAPLLGHYGYPVRSRPDAGRGGVFVEDMRGLRRFDARLRRNVGWVRDQGLGRVLEEKEIDPLRTVPAAVRKWRYRRTASAGNAIPVFVVGLQRSGTNMVVRGLGMAPQVEVHNENDRRAFDRFKLRPDPVIEAIVARSPHSHVLFKPLCDSHRTDHLLDGLQTRRRSRALWVYRDVEGRVRSALDKFADGNLRVLREFADGTNVRRWHVQRISPANAALVRSFDYASMTPASGAALMWYLRNMLFFELELDRRPDVRLVSYNGFVAEPEATMRGLCQFLEFRYDPALVQHVTRRPPTHAAPLEIDPRILERCSELERRLARTAARVSEGIG